MPPPLRRNAPVFVVMNAGSGRHEVDALHAAFTTRLQAAGRRHQLWRVDRHGDVQAAAEQAARAAQAEQGLLVGAGGDGTLNAVARAALAHGCAFGVVAQGTFNYFARAQGLSLDANQAIDDLLHGTLRPVQVGLVNDQPFLVNASVGLYPELLEDREAWKQRLGRNRLVALWAGLVSALGGHRHLRLTLDRGPLGDEAGRTWRTLSLFVGNNRLQLEQVGLPEAPALDAGLLAAVVLKPVSRWQRLGLLLRGAMGRLGEADAIESFVFREMTAAPRLPPGRRRIKVARDGEITWLRPPLRFAVAPQPLWLVSAALTVPAPPADTERPAPAPPIGVALAAS